MLFWALLACTTEKTQGVCLSGSSWSVGQAAFVERSEEWGLIDIQATGTRILAVDFDGDGWTDLLVSKNDEADNFSTGERSTWLLKNDQGKGFVDVTEISGVRMRRDGSTLGRPGQTAAFADVDNDGDLDLFTGYAGDEGGESAELMLNNGDGTFSLAPESEIHTANLSKTSGAAFTDHNLDGKIDLWLSQNASSSGPLQDRLLWGMGDGTFVEVTQSLGLKTQPWVNIDTLNNAESHSNGWSAAACDLNNDGWPELLAASYGRAPNHLWVNQEGETYVNQSISSGYAFDQNVDWTDNEHARCWCKLNPTDNECDGVPEPELMTCISESDAFRWNHSQDRNAFRLGGNSGASVCADINNDGWMDLLTTEIVHWDVGGSSDGSELLFNQQHSDPTFSRPGNEATGLTRSHELVDWNDGDITAAVFDFDADAWPDIYIGSTDYPGTRGLLYRQVSSGQFESVPMEYGIDHRRSHGVAVADFDRDGDLDVVVGHSTGRCQGECYESKHIRLFTAQFEGAANTISIELVGGGGSNVAAIGARVSLTADGVTQTQEVGGGYGHYGAQNDLKLVFGLGAACEATAVINWPDRDRTEQSITLHPGLRYRIVQGQEPQVID